jgi:hypothetical protein
VEGSRGPSGVECWARTCRIFLMPTWWHRGLKQWLSTSTQISTSSTMPSVLCIRIPLQPFLVSGSFSFSIQRL